MLRHPFFFWGPIHGLRYTEKLINNEGLQIGDMADRIVQTEHILSNLTRSCLNCTRKAERGHTIAATASRGGNHSHDRAGRPGDGASGRDTATSAARGPHQAPPTPPWGSAGVDPGRCFICEVEQLSDVLMWNGTRTAGTSLPLGDDPVAPLLEFMNHTLNLMEAMSGNVSAEMQDMEGQIGIMAGRIIGTECLVMNMSRQIGGMADRIVLTEQMMANVSKTCCTAGTIRGKPPTDRDSGRPSSVDTAKTTATGTKQRRRRSQQAAAGLWAGSLASPPSPQPPPDCNQSSAGGMRRDTAAPAARKQPQLVAQQPMLLSLRSRFDSAAARQREDRNGTKCSPLDPICMAIAAMTKMAQGMENVMFGMYGSLDLCPGRRFFVLSMPRCCPPRARLALLRGRCHLPSFFSLLHWPTFRTVMGLHNFPFQVLADAK